LARRAMSAILLYDLETGEPSELLRLEGRIRATRFWDSGKKLFFLLEPLTGAGQYMLLSLGDGTLSAFEGPLRADHGLGRYRLRGRIHAYTYDRGTFVYDVKQKETKKVLASNYLYSIVWSPDGRFLAGVLHRPSRNPLQKLTRLYSDSMKYVYEFWAYDTQTGETLTMKMNDRLREALLLWPR